MKPRIRALLLAVSDISRSTTFYEEGLGLPKASAGGDLVSFDLKGSALALVARDAMSRLTGLVVGEPPDMPASFVAYQADDREEVDAILARAEEAGARVLRRPAENEWGGYSGAFADPDGHAWSVGFNLALYQRG
jgi:uncharacterized glyoxalase superfamily protein PhnB